MIYREINTIAFINDGEVYIKNKGVVEKATPTQIENLIEERMFNRFNEHQKIINNRLDSIINEVELLKESSLQLHLINKIEKKSTRLVEIVKPEVVPPFTDSIDNINNGTADGRVMVVEKVGPRLDDAYLRCSCPKTNKLDLNTFTDVPKFKGKAIAIAPGGGSYYVDSDEEWCILSMTSNLPTLVLTLKDKWKSKLSELYLVSWLKSSILIWYCDTVLGDYNIYKPDIFKKIMVPIIDNQNEIHKLAENIIQLENNLLSDNGCGSCEKNEIICDEDNENCQITHHNKQVDVIANEIDKLFFKNLGLTAAEVNIIKKYYALKNLHSVMLDTNEAPMSNIIQ